MSAVCPGFINTPIVDDAYLDGEFEGKRTQIKGFYERFGSRPTWWRRRSLTFAARR